ncbi:glycosyltransferase [Roseovarius sp. 2305UL8-3]|uniref:glycosyltransferase n=1 Tax=Roseovarius conchicola TaxID=3121636 RepID=UPI0035282B88
MIVGICRFSYPALGGFKRMHDSVAEREAYLYERERMELRFRHFETLSLPSIRGQTDPDFSFLIVVGDTLPKPYSDRLHDITADIPQVKIVPMEPMRQRTAMQVAIKEELGEDTDPSIQFRLDDDDAVGLRFVRSLRRLERQSVAMRRRWKNVAFDFNKGYAVSLSGSGILAREVISNLWTPGLAVWFRPGDRKTLMNYAHHKLHTHMPVISNPLPHMFLRAQHDDNDSGVSLKGGTFEPLDDDQRASFLKHFNVDEDHVKQLFSRPVRPLDRA